MLIVALNTEPESISVLLELTDQEGSKRYELRAVYCYAGNGDSGHYFGVIHSKGLWFICDDSQIQRVNGISKKIARLAKSLLYERVL